MRRNRSQVWLRGLVAENRLAVEDLIWPVFVRDGEGIEEPVPSMPGVVRHSVDRVAEAAQRPEDGTLDPFYLRFLADGVREAEEDALERLLARAGDRLGRVRGRQLGVSVEPG